MTFRRIILKNNAKKRKTFELFIESVPLLKSLEVKFFMRRDSQTLLVWGELLIDASSALTGWLILI